MKQNKQNKLLEGQALVKFSLYEKPRKKLVDWVTEADIFRGYRFKKRRITYNDKGVAIVHAPYIPIGESTDHEFSLTFDEWTKIVKAYWVIVVDKMIEGHQFELHKNLGHIRFVKLAKTKTIRQGHVFSNAHTLGYVPFVIWNRYKHSKLYHRMWYLFNLSRNKQWNRVSKAINKKPSIMFSWPDGLNVPKSKFIKG